MADCNSTRPSTAGAPGPDKDTLVFKLVNIIAQLDAGRAAVYVAKSALEHGDDELCLQCAKSLEDAFDTLDDAHSQAVWLSSELEKGVPDAQ